MWRVWRIFLCFFRWQLLLINIHYILSLATFTSQLFLRYHLQLPGDFKTDFFPPKELSHKCQNESYESAHIWPVLINKFSKSHLMFPLFSKIKHLISTLSKHVGSLLNNQKHFLRWTETGECFKGSGIQTHTLECCI